MGRPSKIQRDPAEMTETERDLDSLLTQLRGLPGEGVSIVLFDVADGRLENLGRFPLNLFSEEVVGKRFGTGRYTWRAMNQNGKWIPGSVESPTRGSFTLSALAYDSREKIMARRDEATAPRASAPAESFGVRELMALMTAQQAAQQAASNQMLTMVMGVMTAAISRPPSPDPVKSLAELYAATKPAAPVETGLGNVREVLALARELSPQAAGGDSSELQSIAQMMTAASPLLLPVLNRMFAPTAARPVAAVAVPPRAPVPALPAPPANPPPTNVGAPVPPVEDSEMWRMQLLQYMRSLVPLAMANKTPAAYVPAFFDQVQDLGVPLDKVRAALFDDMLLPQAKALVPEVKTYEPWFVEFIGLIREDWDEYVDDLTRGRESGDNGGDDPPADP